MRYFGFILYKSLQTQLSYPLFCVIDYTERVSERENKGIRCRVLGPVVQFPHSTSSVHSLLNHQGPLNVSYNAYNTLCIANLLDAIVCSFEFLFSEIKKHAR
jgi:hypothetical protein